MGKGDTRTKRGKIINGSFGNVRPKKSAKALAVAEKPATAKSAKKK